MKIRGTIRRDPGGVNIAFVHDNKWHKLLSSPLKTNIELLYNFLMSKEEQCTLFGRIYKKNKRVRDNNSSTSVKFRGGFSDLTLTRWERKKDGKPNPSDAATVEMTFQTNSEKTSQYVDSNEEGAY
jgi:hypothetical protein